MRYAVVSDIHGSKLWCERALDDIANKEVDAIILLGDIMYHGPRNPLPEGYDPAGVASLLNEHADKVIAVRGNCDSEVDQMLLEFPCMEGHAFIMDGGTRIFCTHGHLDDKDEISMLPEGSVVLSGHTHVKRDEVIDGIRHLNPGSVSIPKDGTHSYLIYEDGEVEFREL